MGSCSKDDPGTHRWGRRILADADKSTGDFMLARRCRDCGLELLEGYVPVYRAMRSGRDIVYERRVRP